MKLRTALMALALVLSTVALGGAVPQRASASLDQCQFQRDAPYNGSGAISDSIEMWCSVAHTRETEACVTFDNGMRTVWDCSIDHGGLYYTTYEYASEYASTYSSSAWLVNGWFWAYDASTGQQWTWWAFNQDQQFWKGPVS